MKSLIELILSLFRKAPEPLKSEPVVTNDIVSRNPQPGFSTTRKAIGGVAGAAVIAAIVAFVQPWEGRRYVAYQDIVGVWTICDGRTKDVHPGDTATPEQCDAWTAEEVTAFDRGVRQCVTREITPNQEVSFVSISYNIGLQAFCNSTAVKRFNSGDDDGACDALQMWNRAGGVVVKGLVNRRTAESVLCKKKAQP